MSASLHLLRKREPLPPPPQSHCHVRSHKSQAPFLCGERKRSIITQWEKLGVWESGASHSALLEEREIGCNYGEVSTKNLCCTFSTTLLWWRQRMCLWERVKTRQEWCKRSDADLPVSRWDVGMKPVPGISTPCSNTVSSKLFFWVLFQFHIFVLYLPVWKKRCELHFEGLKIFCTVLCSSKMLCTFPL